MPDWFYWLRLQHTKGVGPETARRLLAAFGLPSHIFAASTTQLTAIVSPKLAEALLAPVSASLLRLAEQTDAWLQQPSHHLITLADAAYPATLLEIPDPPLLLYVKGRTDLLSARSLGVVGSRNASVQGVRNAGWFAEHLSQAGICISSGMAAGIDAAAHESALAYRGSTIAVVGTGVDIIYPARHKNLEKSIADKGCVISEYSLGTPAIAGNFPRRNRLISGLSAGVLVVEAAAQSGSLITARLAAEQGREVFAIPGSIHSPLAKGCHQLIKQGAKLVESAQDILEELAWFDVTAGSGAHAVLSPASCDSEPASALLQQLAYDPVPLDELGVRTGMDLASLQAQLLELELSGMVETLPGGLVRRLC
ncbi:DNA-processing protein DprA [Undibacterium rugosum]|uniref:DNA-processing protein DprA n=1 Tax=Undibacterium rugosum TaxID=2762291 RepID=UPI001E5A8304|nr:DNA-processing protein DprA [Undibacterium rugosum]